MYEAFIQQSQDQNEQTSERLFVFQRTESKERCCKVFIAGFSGTKWTAIQLMQFSHLLPC